MNNKVSSATKNIIMVCLSNGLTILVGLFMGFILPKNISVDSYANYQIYNLYIAYAGFFHFGLVNGIYIKYGKYDYEDIPYSKFKAFFKSLIVIHIISALALLAFVIFASGGNDIDQRIAYLFVIVNIPLINIKWFFSSINQFTKRFVIDSYLTITQNILNVVAVGCIIAFHLYTYLSILIFTTIMNFVCMSLSIYQNKEIILAKSGKVQLSEVGGLIKTGFFLMLSEFVGIIILGIDSIFVQQFMPKYTFSMYQFAVSIVSLVFTMVTVVTNLVYPYLVRADENKYGLYYTMLSDVVSVVSAAAMAAFYAAKFIIQLWIPKYNDSIPIVAILFGTIVFRILIMLVCGNYFKVLKMIKEYTANNIMAITIGFAFDVIALVVFNDSWYIALASLASFIVWYLITDRKFIKHFELKVKDWMPRYFYIVVSLGAFYFFANHDWVVSIFVYGIFTVIFGIACFAKYIKVINEMRVK